MEPLDVERERTPRLAHDRWWCAAMVAVVLLPLVVSAVQLVTAVGSSYHPPTDWALLELQTRDVGRHLVTVGPYSRFGWNHPGPLMFYVLYGPYRLFGSQSFALHIGALLVNGMAIVGCGLVAFRRGRAPVVIAVMVPLALLVRSMGIEEVRDPWNPYLPLLPLLLLVLLAWSVSLGDLWMAPIAVGVATFVVQSHVGFAIESLALLVVAAFGLVLRGVRTDPGGRRQYWRRAGWVSLVSLAVALVLWAPVIYGSTLEQDGNVAAMWRFFTSSQPTFGLDNALRVMGLQWGPRPEWALGARGTGFFGQMFVEPRWWFAVGLAAGAAATVVAARRRDREVLWFAGLVAAGFVAGTYAVSTIIGEVYPYIVRWTWVLGTALGVLVLLGGWSALSPAGRARMLRPTAVAAACVLVVLAVVETVEVIDAATPHASQQAAERAMAARVLPVIPRGEGPVLVVDEGGAFGVAGLVNQLERHGIPTVVRPDQPFVYGSWRSPRGGYRAILHVVQGAALDRPPPPGERIARWQRALTVEERRSVEHFVESTRAMAPGPERDRLLADALALLDAPADRFEVYLERTESVDAGLRSVGAGARAGTPRRPARTSPR